MRPSLSEGPPVEKRQALVGVLKALLILTPVFGLTWGLGVATLLDQVSEVPHYIFTILNSLQVLEALSKRFCGTQPSNSAISLATNETYISEPGKRSEHASYEERMNT
uniref:Adhesion G protein-coupled receptor F3 n=1 Tax=Nannospalax galili TaxID=1026970 RepID=A0A8C6REV1_NANGA